jgi:hypothetical protein
MVIKTRVEELSIGTLLTAAGVFLAAFALSFVVFLFIALPFKWLWNDAMVPAIGVSPIGYWDSVKLLMVLKIAHVAAVGVKVRLKTK